MSHHEFSADAVKALEAALATPSPGLSQAFRLKPLLEEMRARAPGEAPHRRFEEVCKLATSAFGDEPLTDESILANEVTPHLIRYLLSALTTYQLELSRGVATTRDRADAVAQGLMMVGRVEKNATTRKWSEEDQMRYYSAFHRGLMEAFEKGASRVAAYKAGIKAAYEAYRNGAEGERSGSEIGKVKRMLRQLVAQHGHLPPPKN